MSDAFERFSQLDVSVRDDRGGRPPPRDRGPRPNDRDRGPRPKLEFREVNVLEQGDCRCKITVADGMHGKIYNFAVERVGRDRPSRFFRDRDAGDLAALVIQAGKWIENERGS